MIARRIAHRLMANAEPFLVRETGLTAGAARRIIRQIDSGQVSVGHRTALAHPCDWLAQQGFLEFALSGPLALRLTPCTTAFATSGFPNVSKGTWKRSRFAFDQVENSRHLVRNLNSDCYVTVESDRLAALLHRLTEPTDLATLIPRGRGKAVVAAALGALRRAQVILPCDQAGRTIDELDPNRRQWEFHDLLFHTFSRTGRTEREFGGTCRFKRELPPAPAVRKHPWTRHVIPLPRIDIATLMLVDAPFTAVLEQRRSIRNYSAFPLSSQQLGEFLFRTCRVRHQYANDHGEFTSRPYPGAGACYEQEFYLTVDACGDLPRGFYYYDAVAHALCPVSPPNPHTEGMLNDAGMAMGLQVRPQVLITIASRFHRVGWKYAGISYAAQLKNVGAIYQTMYLVATAMRIAACGLGAGNSTRFAALTGLPSLEEGSIGEFAIGRPS